MRCDAIVRGNPQAAFGHSRPVAPIQRAEPLRRGGCESGLAYACVISIKILCLYARFALDTTWPTTCNFCLWFRIGHGDPVPFNLAWFGKATTAGVPVCAFYYFILSSQNCWRILVSMSLSVCACMCNISHVFQCGIVHVPVSHGFRRRTHFCALGLCCFAFVFFVLFYCARVSFY